MTESRTVNLVPLTSSNYTTWKLQCQMALMREGLWSIVNATEVSPADGVDEATRQKYEARKDRALATIVLSIDTSLLYLLGEPKDPVEVWRKLENQFQKKNCMDKQADTPSETSYTTSRSWKVGTGSCQRDD